MTLTVILALALLGADPKPAGKNLAYEVQAKAATAARISAINAELKSLIALAKRALQPRT